MTFNDGQKTRNEDFKEKTPVLSLADKMHKYTIPGRYWERIKSYFLQKKTETVQQGK
jgi:hypothetical protein